MAYARRAGASIHYSAAGRGAPLVLIEGLGYGPWMWREQTGPLGAARSLLLVDNRGISPSTPLSGPYSIDEFAQDVLAVLDAEGLPRASLLGVSMGGFIAQALARLAPERVERLVLVSTSPGGPGALPMPAETWAELVRNVQGESAADRLRRTMTLALSPTFATQRSHDFDALIQARLTAPQDPQQWAWQAEAAVPFDASGAASGLACPTLIVAGTADRVLPWTNSILLFRLIPRSRLLLFRGGNHLCFLERADEFNRAVLEFLDAPADRPATVREVG